MNHSMKINEIATALAKAQGAFKPVPRDAKNPFLKNDYATLDAIIEAIREPLFVNDLSFMQLLCSNKNGKPAIETVVLHSSGQWISGKAIIPPMDVPKGLNVMQTMGVGVSYTKRYGLAAALGISVGGDNDGFTGSTTVKKESPVTKGAQHFDATYVRSLMSSQDKPYMIFGNETEKASWFKGRTTLLTTAPWLTEQGVTKETLGVLDADNALAGVRIHYAFSTKTDNDGNPYKNVVSVEKIGE